MRTTTLYRMYDRDDYLVYVGITFNIPNRFAKHKHRPWWPSIERIEMQHYDSKAEALAAETLAIATEDPLVNLSRPSVRHEVDEVVEFVNCSVCRRELVDVRAPGDEPIDRCGPCDEAVCDAHASGAQWAFADTRRRN